MIGWPSIVNSIVCANPTSIDCWSGMNVSINVDRNGDSTVI